MSPRLSFIHIARSRWQPYQDRTDGVDSAVLGSARVMPRASSENISTRLRAYSTLAPPSTSFRASPTSGLLKFFRILCRYGQESEFSRGEGFERNPPFLINRLLTFCRECVKGRTHFLNLPQTRQDSLPHRHEVVGHMTLFLTAKSPCRC